MRYVIIDCNDQYLCESGEAIDSPYYFSASKSQAKCFISIDTARMVRDSLGLECDCSIDNIPLNR